MPKKVADEMIKAFHGHHVSELPEHADGKKAVYAKIYGTS